MPSLLEPLLKPVIGLALGLGIVALVVLGLKLWGDHKYRQGEAAADQKWELASKVAKGIQSTVKVAVDAYQQHEVDQLNTTIARLSASKKQAVDEATHAAGPNPGPVIPRSVVRSLNAIR